MNGICPICVPENLDKLPEIHIWKCSECREIYIKSDCSDECELGWQKQ
jgi:ribosomal protein L37AE/L43A